MASIWEKFNKTVDTVGLAADIREAEENGARSYKEVPHGVYEVEVNKLEPKLSKKGDAMVSIWFKIISGEYKGSMIFYNQVITSAFSVHKANEMLRDLTAELPDIDIPHGCDNFDFAAYESLIMDVAEAIDGNFEYQLDYSEGKKGFNEYKIEEVFVLD